MIIFVKEDALRNALYAAQKIEFFGDRVKALLENLGHYTREELLADLCAFSPVIAKLGGEEVIAETICAIQDVGRWGP